MGAPPNKATNICMEPDCKEYHGERYYCDDCNGRTLDDGTTIHDHQPNRVHDEVSERIKLWQELMERTDRSLKEVD
jgi:hypothetical protein